MEFLSEKYLETKLFLFSVCYTALKPQFCEIGLYGGSGGEAFVDKNYVNYGKITGIQIRHGLMVDRLETLSLISHEI